MKASSFCRSCQSPIRWCITEANGKRMPVDPDPVHDGNVWIVRYEQGTPIIGVALHGDGVPANEPIRYVSHFVTCPSANEWRHR